MNLFRILILLFIPLLFIGCQTKKSEISYATFNGDTLREHNLQLNKPIATFNDGLLIINGSISPIEKRPEVPCGELKLKIFDTQGMLLKEINTDYSPCHLHYGPHTKRSGTFNITINDIIRQKLLIKLYYKQKSHHDH